MSSDTVEGVAEFTVIGSEDCNGLRCGKNPLQEIEKCQRDCLNFRLEFSARLVLRIVTVYLPVTAHCRR